jgi:hypothetical protein
VIQVTHRLTLSPTAAIELLNSLNTTLTALRRREDSGKLVIVKRTNSGGMRPSKDRFTAGHRDGRA